MSLSVSPGVQGLPPMSNHAVDPQYDALRRVTKALAFHSAQLKATMEVYARLQREAFDASRAVARAFQFMCQDESLSVHPSVRAVAERFAVDIEREAAVAVPTVLQAWHQETIQRLNGLIASVEALKSSKDERSKRVETLGSTVTSLMEKERALGKRAKATSASRSWGVLRHNAEFATSSFMATDAAFKAEATALTDRKDATIGSVVQSHLFHMGRMAGALGTVYMGLYNATTTM